MDAVIGEEAFTLNAFLFFPGLILFGIRVVPGLRGYPESQFNCKILSAKEIPSPY